MTLERHAVAFRWCFITSPSWGKDLHRVNGSRLILMFYLPTAVWKIALIKHRIAAFAGSQGRKKIKMLHFSCRDEYYRM